MAVFPGQPRGDRVRGAASGSELDPCSHYLTIFNKLVNLLGLHFLSCTVGGITYNIQASAGMAAKQQVKGQTAMTLVQ